MMPTKAPASRIMNTMSTVEVMDVVAVRLKNKYNNIGVAFRLDSKETDVFSVLPVMKTDTKWRSMLPTFGQQWWLYFMLHMFRGWTAWRCKVIGGGEVFQIV